MRGVDVPGDKYWKHPFDTSEHLNIKTFKPSIYLSVDLSKFHQFLSKCYSHVSLGLLDSFQYFSSMLTFFNFLTFSVLTRRHLTEFVVLDVEPVDMRTVSVAAHAQRFFNPHAKKHLSSTAMEDTESLCSTIHSNLVFSNPRCDPLAGRLVDVEIARASDFGVNDTRTVVRSHIGRSLHVGDWCLGYDLARLNLGGIDEDTGIETKVQLLPTTFVRMCLYLSAFHSV